MKYILVVVLFFACTPASGIVLEFIRGDVDNSGRVDINDAIVMHSNLYLTGLQFSCLKAADVNDNGAVQQDDLVLMLQHLFLDGPAIAPPWQRCGIDPTPDGLSCEFSSCF